jgi:hypothetical protein
MLVQPQAWQAPAQQTHQRCLAGLKRFAPQVLAVQLEQVEGEQEHVVIVAPVAQPLEHRDPVLIADDGLAVDQAGPRRQRARRRDDLRKAVREVIAFPREQSHTAFDPAGHDAEAVVLDFVNPAWACRRLLGRTG